MTRVNREPPDFRAFHESIAAELEMVRNRVRNLIRDRHWLTDGEYKETVLRSVIRRHLPISMVIGRGFVIGEHDVSTQIDVLIVDGDAPVLFQEGDLMIVTPDAVRAVIEVKTRLQAGGYADAFNKLGAIAAMCDSPRGGSVWTGLFVFEDDQVDDTVVLKALAGSARVTNGHVQCVASGPSRFVRYWDDATGTLPGITNPFWRSYEIRNLAPSYFVGNLMSNLAGNSRHAHDYAWFPEIGGKEMHKRFQIQVDSDEPEECQRR